MIYAKTISLVAALALASQAVAEPLGKGRLLVSTRDMFGLEGRSDATYKPKTAVCGLGSDCSAVSHTTSAYFILFGLSSLDFSTDKTMTHSAGPLSRNALLMTSTSIATIRPPTRPAARMAAAVLANLVTTATLVG